MAVQFLLGDTPCAKPKPLLFQVPGTDVTAEQSALNPPSIELQRTACIALRCIALHCYLRLHLFLIWLQVPGTDVTAEQSALATLLVNIIFIIGILVFAVLLGMVAEEVSVTAVAAIVSKHQGGGGGSECG